MVGEEPNAGALGAPNLGVAETPNGGVLGTPKAGVFVLPKAGVLDPKGELETPNADPVVLVVPNAEVLAVPNAGVLDTPKAGWLPAPKFDEPNGVLPKAGCDCVNELPKGLDAGVDPNPPNAGFYPNADEPQRIIKYIAQLLFVMLSVQSQKEFHRACGGDDEAPKTDVDPIGEEAGVPNIPVDVPPKIKLPVCAPKGVAPKGVILPKGLLFALLVCPKTDGDPNGLLDDCPSFLSF
nr:hypothetical protein [Tanacetum cinerariifolium]